MSRFGTHVSKLTRKNKNNKKKKSMHQPAWGVRFGAGKSGKKESSSRKKDNPPPMVDLDTFLSGKGGFFMAQNLKRSLKKSKKSKKSDVRPLIESGKHFPSEMVESSYVEQEEEEEKSTATRLPAVRYFVRLLKGSNKKRSEKEFEFKVYEEKEIAKGNISIFESLKLSLLLSVQGLLAILPMVAYLLYVLALYSQIFRKDFTLKSALYHVDYSAREEIFVQANSIDYRHRTMLEDALGEGLVFCFFPVLMHQFLGIKLWTRTSFLVLSPWYSCLAIYYVGWVVLGYTVARAFTLAFNVFLLWAVLVFLYGFHSKIPKQIGYLALTILGGLIANYFQGYYKGTIEGAGAGYSEIIRLGLVYPLLREAGRFLLTKMSWHFAVDKDIGDTANRHLAWVFVAWYQIGVAFVHRLAVANVDDQAVSVFIIVLQSGWEILSRLSMKRRDQVLNSVLAELVPKLEQTKNSFMLWFTRNSESGSLLNLKRAQSGLRKAADVVDLESVFEEASIVSEHESSEGTSKVTPAASLDRDRAKSSTNHMYALAERLQARKKSRRFFYSFLVLSDMIGEYMAITLTPVLFFAFKERVLFTHLAFYRIGGAETFNSEAQNESFQQILRLTLVQYLFECFSDTVCVYIEIRWMKLKVREAWKTRPSSFMRYLLFASFFVFTILLRFLQTLRQLGACEEKNICYCSNNQGIPYQTSLDDYCRLLYPDNDGVPPSD